MTQEESNLKLIKVIAHVQCVQRGLDELNGVDMHYSVKNVLKDSKTIFKAVEQHIAQQRLF